MKWVLIIIVLGVGWSKQVSQQEVGPFSTEKACLAAAEKIPNVIRSSNGIITSKLAHIKTLCIQVDANE